MRSSKQRSRGNKNRNNRPTGGNVINRVFDSSGPDGKVRGTPQQIIEKYLQLHRDAQLSGDRVNAENFAQHAEHYTRILAEAQREVERQREEQEQFNRDRQAERDRERAQRQRGHDYATDPAQMDQPDIELPMGDDLLVDVVEVAQQDDLPEGKPSFLGNRQDRRQPRERGERFERQDRRPPRQDRNQERNGDQADQPAEAPAPRAPRPAAPSTEAEAPVVTQAGFAEGDQPAFLTSKAPRAKPQVVADVPAAVDAAEDAPKRTPRPRKPRAPKAAPEAAE